jgi:glycosyltransferase involved in cell wall biosynthesis
MIDVMHVISGLGVGGAETMLAQLVSGLRARGLSQHVISLTALDSLAGEVRAAGVELTVLGARSPTSSLTVAAKLFRAVNRARPRILQGWMYHGNIAALLGHAVGAGRRHRKLFWNLRASNMDAARYARVIRFGALLSGLVDLTIVNSHAGEGFHRDHGYRPKRLEIIDNGIDTEKYCPDSVARKQVRAELGLADDTTVVIHVARVDPMKDHASFLAAMAQSPSVAGILVGDGTTGLTVPANVRALGLRRDTARLFAAADIVASSSAYGEGFSNIIAEGMSAGLIPVATNVGDARRIVAEVGAIVPAGDPDAFARAIAILASLPAQERAQKSALARARIVDNFSLARAIDRYAHLYTTDTLPIALTAAG